MRSLWDIIRHSDEKEFPMECVTTILNLISSGTAKENWREFLSCCFSIASWLLNNGTPDNPVIGMFLSFLDNSRSPKAIGTSLPTESPTVSSVQMQVMSCMEESE